MQVGAESRQIPSPRDNAATARGEPASPRARRLRCGRYWLADRDDVDLLDESAGIAHRHEVGRLEGAGLGLDGDGEVASARR